MLSMPPSGHTIRPVASRVKSGVSYIFTLFAANSRPVTSSDEWGRKFKAAREAHSSQERFAAKFRIPRRTLSRWENGRMQPGPKYRKMLAGISPEFKAVVAELPEVDDQGLRDHLGELEGEVATLAAVLTRLVEAQPPVLREQLLHVLAGDSD